MDIRPARREDVPALLDIYNYEVINGAATLDLNTRTLEEWEKWYDAHNRDNHPLIVGVEDGEITGIRKPVGIPPKGSVQDNGRAVYIRLPEPPQKGSGTRAHGSYYRNSEE